MNQKLSIIMSVLLVAIIVSMFLWKAKGVDDAIAFDDIQVETDENALGQIASGYISLPSLSADEDSIGSLIGAVAIRTRTESGEDDWSYDMRFRPSRELIGTKIVDEKLYHGVVSAKANFGGRFQIATGNATAEDLAETTIRNQMIAGYKDQSDIPFQSLGKVRIAPDKDYFFVESVIVTDITTRRFRKQTGSGKIEGMAFGANGSVYSEQGALKSQKVVSFRPINLLDLQSSEAGSDETTKLTSKSRRQKLSSDEASVLVGSLREKAKVLAPSSAPLNRPHSTLPSRLRGLEPLVWLENIQPQRQSSLNRCWAATMAMMFSWRKGRQVGEVEAVTCLGPYFVSLYERDAPLPKSYKYDLLESAALKYSAPQSYSQQGLISLLEEHGPVWFTIDKEFGRHATVLTGVFLNRRTDEHWLSYIDPIDGSLNADSYVSYMRRYEAPAYRANDEGVDIAITERDLDIQVVHW